VEDVARVLYDISGRSRALQRPVSSLRAAKFLATSSVPPILHFSSQVQFTKYKISCLFAKLFGVEGTDHLLPQREAPGPEETPRPRDCYMSNKALEVRRMSEVATMLNI
jgi:S-adenosylmethionine synthetase